MMSNTFSSFGGFAFWHHLHWIFILTLLVGLIFFVAWALKNLKKERLGNWALVLVIVGVLGMLLTSSFGTFGWGGRGSGYGMMMTPGMWDCAQDDECHEEMEDFMDRMMNFDRSSR